MTLLDDTLTAAADLGRTAAHQAAEAATTAGREISDAAQQSHAALDDLGDVVTGTDRGIGRRIAVLALVAAIVGFVVWRRRADRNEADRTSSSEKPPVPARGRAVTPEEAMSPNVDTAARADGTG